MDTAARAGAVMFAVAVLYWKDGRLGPSRTMLREVLALDPAHRDAANLLETIVLKHG